MEYILFFDTNALLNLQENAFKEPFIIAQKTLEEIESIKSSGHKDNDVKYKARQIARLLDENEGNYTVVPFSNEIKEIVNSFHLDETPDNIILASAYSLSKDNNVLVVSDDLNCKFISKQIFKLRTKGINEIHLVKNYDEYKGYKEVVMTDDEMNWFYNHTHENSFDCILNEYLIIKNSDNEIIDYRKWNGKEYHVLSYKQINNKFFGKVKPINPQQVLAFDMLQDKNKTIKVISGRMGSGKDFLMISNALKLIDEGKYDKLVYVRNPIGVRGIEEIGYLRGDMHDKLRPFSSALADHLGGEQGLDMQIMAGNIEIEHIGFIRGRDYKNTIIYVTEAENLSKDHVQLLIGRVGEGSALWMNGDYKQVDSPIFRMNNGLLSAVQRLAGNDKFGYVQLQKTERSETASLADLLD